MVQKVGFLWKAGAINTEFKFRYFKLSGTKLNYFKNSEDASAQGYIDLSDATDCKIVSADPVNFEITTPKRVWRLKATTAKECSDWQKAVYVAIVGGAPPSAPSAPEFLSSTRQDVTVQLLRPESKPSDLPITGYLVKMAFDESALDAAEPLTVSSPGNQAEIFTTAVPSSQSLFIKAAAMNIAGASDYSAAAGPFSTLGVASSSAAKSTPARRERAKTVIASPPAAARVAVNRIPDEISGLDLRPFKNGDIRERAKAAQALREFAFNDVLPQPSRLLPYIFDLFYRDGDSDSTSKDLADTVRMILDKHPQACTENIGLIADLLVEIASNPDAADEKNFDMLETAMVQPCCLYGESNSSVGGQLFGPMCILLRRGGLTITAEEFAITFVINYVESFPQQAAIHAQPLIGAARRVPRLASVVPSLFALASDDFLFCASHVVDTFLATASGSISQRQLLNILVTMARRDAAQFKGRAAAFKPVFKERTLRLLLLNFLAHVARFDADSVYELVDDIRDVLSEEDTNSFRRVGAEIFGFIGRAKRPLEMLSHISDIALDPATDETAAMHCLFAFQNIAETNKEAMDSYMDSVQEMKDSSSSQAVRAAAAEFLAVADGKPITETEAKNRSIRSECSTFAQLKSYISSHAEEIRTYLKDQVASKMPLPSEFSLDPVSPSLELRFRCSLLCSRHCAHPTSTRSLIVPTPHWSQWLRLSLLTSVLQSSTFLDAEGQSSISSSSSGTDMMESAYDLLSASSSGVILSFLSHLSSFYMSPEQIDELAAPLTSTGFKRVNAEEGWACSPCSEAAAAGTRETWVQGEANAASSSSGASASAASSSSSESDSSNNDSDLYIIAENGERIKVLKQGMVSKKGKLGGRWVDRYLRLDEKYLISYEMGREDQAQRFVVATEITNVKALDPKTAKFENGFLLNGKRPTEYKAHSKEDCEQWISLINGIINQKIQESIAPINYSLNQPITPVAVSAEAEASSTPAVTPVVEAAYSPAPAVTPAVAEANVVPATVVAETPAASSSSSEESAPTPVSAASQ